VKLHHVSIARVRDLCKFLPSLQLRLTRIAVQKPGGNSFGKPVTCRNIKSLFNFTPTVAEDEIRAAASQMVKKVSGIKKPFKANEAAFVAAADGFVAISRKPLQSPETSVPPKYREVEAARSLQRSTRR